MILIGAAGVSGVLGELIDAAAVMAIVLLNAVLGCIQEYRAKSLSRCSRRWPRRRARCGGGGGAIRLAAVELVPGDLVLLKEGDRVPADARLITRERA